MGSEEGVGVWEGRHCVCGRQRKACGAIASGDGEGGEDAVTGSAGGRWEGVRGGGLRRGNFSRGVLGRSCNLRRRKGARTLEI